MSDPTLDPNLNDPEHRTLASLASLRPTRATADFAQLAIASLERSHRRSLRTWRAVAATLAIALGVSLVVPMASWIEPPASPGELVVTPPAPSLPAPSSSPSYERTVVPPEHAWPATIRGSEQLALREALLERGLDALPDTTHRRGDPTPAFLPPRSLPPASGV